MNLWARLEGARILLVDDDEMIRDSMTLFFEDQGSIFQAVGSSELALDVLEKDCFDIIVLDYKLPGMSGMDLLKQIRKTHPAPAKIFVTAYSNDSVAAQAAEYGADGFIRKPLSAEKIEDCLSGIPWRDGGEGCGKEDQTRVEA